MLEYTWQQKKTLLEYNEACTLKTEKRDLSKDYIVALFLCQKRKAAAAEVNIYKELMCNRKSVNDCSYILYSDRTLVWGFILNIFLNKKVSNTIFSNLMK